MGSAQEDVPSGVWNRVSAGLDAKAAPAFAWWQIAAVAVAAAAAIVAGIIIPGSRDNSTQPHINTIAVVEQPETEAATLLAEVIAPAQTITISTTKHERVSVKQEASETASPASSDETQSFAVPENKPKTSEPLQSKTQKSQEPVTDPFAGLDKETGLSGHKTGISITAGGSIGSNGNPKESGFGMRKTSPLSSLARKGIKEVSEHSTYALPVTAGLGVRFDLGQNWSIGTGINWTMLERTFNGTYTSFNADGTVADEINGSIKNTLHYVGIPVNVYYDMLKGEKTRFYIYAGGTFEKGISNRYRIPGTSGNIFYSEKMKGLQFSAATGFGVEFLLSKNVGIYFDPSLRYYFDCKQPSSLRTQQPLMLNLELGLRLDL